MGYGISKISGLEVTNGKHRCCCIYMEQHSLLGAIIRRASERNFEGAVKALKTRPRELDSQLERCSSPEY